MPAEIYKLGNLSELRLPFNNFWGTISPDIENMTYLSSLNIACIYYEGALPKELCNLSFLYEFDFSHLIPENPGHAIFKNIWDGYNPNAVASSLPSTRNWFDSINQTEMMAISPHNEAAIARCKNRILIGNIPLYFLSDDDYNLLHNSI